MGCDPKPVAWGELFAGLEVGVAERGFGESAEQTYRIALGILPSNTDAVIGLADLLERGGRSGDARTLLDQFGRDYPKQIGDLNRARARGSVTFQYSTGR